jgi:hypothetical protein
MKKIYVMPVSQRLEIKIQSHLVNYTAETTDPNDGGDNLGNSKSNSYNYFSEDFESWNDKRDAGWK